MPCNCDHMGANNREVELSKIACCLEEILERKKINKNDWGGYHPKIYSKHISNKKANEMISKLCRLCSEADDITKYSLELQMWWRDHQELDRQRLERERIEALDKKHREEGLAKLTKEEKKALGL